MSSVIFQDIIDRDNGWRNGRSTAAASPPRQRAEAIFYGIISGFPPVRKGYKDALPERARRPPAASRCGGLGPGAGPGRRRAIEKANEKDTAAGLRKFLGILP